MAFTLFLAWMLAWCAIDRYAHLTRDIRIGALAVGVALVLGRMTPAILMIRRRPDWLSAATEVERQNPRFAQRLVTVTSRVLGAANYRGSDEILLRLVREVDEQVAENPAGHSVPLRAALRSWLACTLLLLCYGALLGIPTFRFRELAERFLNPLSGVPPVTTTQLTVTPGDGDVVQSRPLTIEVEATRLGDSPVALYLNDDDRNWSRVTMSSAAAGRFTFALASVDRDLRYYVTAGDARSPEFLLRVLRRPAVVQFNIRYEYPAYTRLPAGTVTNTDGRIEAPAGTRASLTVTATEPLQAALLTIGSERLLMDRGADEYSRHTELVIRSDAKYALDLISTRNVAGSGPATTAIRAVPDLPPQIRLARAGDSLRLNPRDIVPVWYEAMDDYGLKSLSIRAQVNGQGPIDVRVRLWGDRRRQQDVFNFDLATLPLGMGDVIKLTAVGTDTADQTTESAPLQIVISPRSVDLDAYQRIEELHNAAQLSQSLSAQLEDAVKSRADADGQKDRQSTEYQSALSRADRALSSASQTATLLRQALLRATTHAHVPQLCVALADAVDAAELESAAADDAFRQSGTSSGLGDVQRERLRHAFDRSHPLQTQLNAIEQGEKAAAILADYENMQATLKRPEPKDEAGKRRVRETVARMRQDIAAEAGQLRLDPGSNDLDNQLRARIRAEQDVLDAARTVDFIAEAREWSQQLQRDPQQRLGFESRLSSAAQAEAIRPDADLVRARDIELASRAAAAIVASGRSSGRLLTAGILNGFVADIESLQHFREFEQHPEQVHNPAEMQLARKAAIKAQQDLARSSGDSVALAALTTRGAGPSAEDRQKDEENLAMQASAAAARHQYKQAALFDESLAQRFQSAPRKEMSSTTVDGESSAARDRVERHQQAVQREMTVAHTLDDLGQQQHKLNQPIPPALSGELAGKQQDVADQIARVEQGQRQGGDLPSMADSPNGRDRAASQVLLAQEELSSMPQMLAIAQSAAAAQREAAMRAKLARQAAKDAPPDQRDAAGRAADEADDNARDAASKVTQSMQALSIASSQKMADRLGPFAPETDGARAVILGQLAAALQSLHQAFDGADESAVDRAANETRKAIEASQRELSLAQEELLKRDPLVAARWFAKAAADSLSKRPPDMSHAKASQASTSAALSRAWDQSIHRAATERLAAVPSLAAVLDAPAPAANGPAQQTNKFAAAREWGRLRPQEGADVNASMHDVDPPGYEESLKLYFEALGKAQEAK